MNNLLARLVPFLFLGMILVIFVIGIIFLSYLLILGAIVGLALFVVAWLKEKFFPVKDLQKQERKPRKGRTIDHDK